MTTFETKTNKNKKEIDFNIKPIIGLGWIKESTIISHTHFQSIIVIKIVILFVVITINYLKTKN